MNEADLMRLIQIRASELGARLFRNNVALAWVGHPCIRQPNGDVLVKNARPLHAGLCVGSSDLIGFTKTGRFLAVEIKIGDGRLSAEQKTFIEVVKKNSGIAGPAWSVEDFEKLLEESN